MTSKQAETLTITYRSLTTVLMGVVTFFATQTYYQVKAQGEAQAAVNAKLNVLDYQQQVNDRRLSTLEADNRSFYSFKARTEALQSKHR